MPHLGIDAIVAAADIVMDLQTIVSREIDPLEPVVISLGKINGGVSYNVICDKVVIEGTTRSFNVDIQKSLPLAIKRIIDRAASSFNAEAELTYTAGALPCINDPILSEIAKKSISKLYGNEVIGNLKKTMGTEDFAYFAQKVPGVIAFLGGGNKSKNSNYPHHHEKFDIDVDAWPIGVSLYVQFALDYLEK